MKTPHFWYQSPGLLSTLLWPLGWLYGAAGKIRSHFIKPQRFQIPIISIGNIVSGGAGKTPTAIALMHLLKTRGYKVHFVTRGYGGQEWGPLRVDPNLHKARDVGDEPLLLSQHAPTWVAKNRPCGVAKAMEHGAQLVILDDGHQTVHLHKDVSFVVVDLLQGFGNGCVIPAGPLREELSAGLKRADGIIEVGSASQEITLATGEGLTHFNATIVPQPLTLPSNRVVAFCGLGFPQKFYTSLKELSLEIIAQKTFPDHYQYTNDDLTNLQKLAVKHNSTLVTTRKDLVKIPPSWQEQIHVLDIKINFEDPEELCDYIVQKISSTHI